MGYSIENRVIKLLQNVDPSKRAQSRGDVGLAALSLAPSLRRAVQRDVLWAKNPQRPINKTRARVNIYEDKKQRIMLNRSDFTS